MSSIWQLGSILLGQGAQLEKFSSKSFNIFSKCLNYA